jgi:hypothetical protein
VRQKREGERRRERKRGRERERGRIVVAHITSEKNIYSITG